MRWQKALGWVISIFVVAFIGYLGYSMRRQAAIPDKTQKPAPEPPPEAKFYSPSPGVFQLFDDDRLVFELKPTKFTQLGEDRYLMTDGVELMTDRNGKKLTITAREADAKVKDGTQVESATFKQDVHLTTAAGLDVKAGEASYVESEGIVTIPVSVSACHKDP